MPQPSQSRRRVVAVIDDDMATCFSLQRLLRSYGFESKSFESAAAFMAQGHPREFACLILDVRMPGMTGPELHDRLLKSDILVPIIYITGYIDDAVLSGVRRPGTVKILEKPFDEKELITHVRAAVQVFRRDEEDSGDVH